MSIGPRTLCGPADLIAELLEDREFGRRRAPEVYGNMTDEAVRRLVMLAYFASQTVEEGRYPRFRLFVPPASIAHTDASSWHLLRFTEPLELNAVDVLRRLASGALSHDLALEIEEQTKDGELILACIGIRLAYSDEPGAKLFSSSPWAQDMPPGLMIRVDGPGELRVSEARRPIDLRAGRLVALGGVPLLAIQAWIEGLACRLAKEGRPANQVSHILYFTWNELIRLASDQGRGACFVVLPNESLAHQDLTAKDGIAIKYRTTGLNLANAVVEFMDSCVPDAAPFDKEAADKWIRRRHRLLTQLDCLATLAGVDGCTVFDRNSELLGFGGKILVQDIEPTRQFKDFREDSAIQPDALNKTGTRHLSAFKLCSKHEGTFCYVVSQDGPVTLIWSDAKTVSRWTPYWPGVRRSGHF